MMERFLPHGRRGSAVVRLATLALLVASLVGCSREVPVQVKGTVLVNNAPVSGVYVILHTPTGETAGSGCSLQDGTFHLTVEHPGEYPVTCFFPKMTKVMDDYIAGDDQFKGRYRNWQKPAATASLQAGENTLPPLSLR